MTVNIKGKWALVTGASRGVGQQIAVGLGKLGVNVVLHARSESHLAQTRDLVAPMGVQTASLGCDLADFEALDEMAAKAESLTGGVQILYNNGAIMTAETPLFETPIEDYERSLRVNVYAPIRLCQFFAPRMRERGFGRIINTTSGIKDTPFLDAYSISKAALDKYTRDLAVELANTGVLANLLDPGWCRTDLGGPKAWNDVTSVLPGALLPALLGKTGDEEPRAMLFAAQDYAGMPWPAI